MSERQYLCTSMKLGGEFDFNCSACGKASDVVGDVVTHHCPVRHENALADVMRLMARFMIWVECEAWAMAGFVFDGDKEFGSDLDEWRQDMLCDALVKGKLKLAWPDKESEDE
jgi:hypothetical protein